MLEKEFTYNGRTLHVKALPYDLEWRVAVYEGDRPVTNVNYTVSHITNVDDSIQSGITNNTVNQLMDLAKNDIENGNVSIF